MADYQSENRFYTIADLWNSEEARIVWTDEKGIGGEVGFDVVVKNSRDLPFEANFNPIKKGGFGWVREVTYKGEIIGVLKQIPRDGQQLWWQSPQTIHFQKEVAHHRKCPHYHIVQAFGSFIYENNYNILLTPRADCDLGQYMESPRDYKSCGDPDTILLQHFGCLASTLRHIHQKQMKHLDIKPSNIVLERHRCLMTDFGLTREFESQSTSSDPPKSTKKYEAPEIANGEYSKRASDIFSLGCTYVEMYTCKKTGTIENIPGAKDPDGRYWNRVDSVMAYLRSLSTKGSSQYDQRILNLLDQMLSQDPSLRPTAATVWERMTNYRDENGRYYCGPCCMPYSHTQLNPKHDQSSDAIRLHEYQEFQLEKAETQDWEWRENVRFTQDVIYDIVRIDINPADVARKRRIVPQIKMEEVKDDFEDAFDALKKLTHRHIVTMQKPYTQGSNIVAVCSQPPTGHTLRAHMHEIVWERQQLTPNEPPTESLNKKCAFLGESFGCLAAAVYYVHQRDCLHGNIRPENVLLHNDRVFLSGFLQGTEFDDYRDFRKTLLLPPDLFDAPEKKSIRSTQPVKADIYMLGCTFLEMYTVLRMRNLTQLAEARSESTSPIANYKSTLESCKTWLMKIKGTNDDDLVQLLCEMIDKNPTKRPDARSVYERLQGYTTEHGAQVINLCGSFCRNRPPAIAELESRQLKKMEVRSR